ncbi:MAG: DUF4349 domain-containing protein [Sphingosinicella sp.]|nr:DUF4349 domain-containing protein [Sphingosinicella sp.]
MNIRACLAFGLALMVAACGQQGAPTQSTTALKAFDAEAAAPAKPDATGEEVKTAVPQIAYTHLYTFRLASEAVSGVQEKHVALCEKLGPARCRIVDLKRSASSGDYVNGSLTLQVAAPIAAQFGQRIVAAATEAGAETVDRGISGEDLSKQIVDTDARIRTKEALVARLTQILATRSGNIEQAVAAERAVNVAQEELEQARAWLVEMRGRVAMSTFEIGYESGAPLAGGFSEPIQGAFATVGELFGKSLGLIILVVAALLPWVLIALGIILAMRAARRRGWWGRKAEPEPEALSENRSAHLEGQA